MDKWPSIIFWDTYKKKLYFETPIKRIIFRDTSQKNLYFETSYQKNLYFETPIKSTYILRHLSEELIFWDTYQKKLPRAIWIFLYFISWSIYVYCSVAEAKVDAFFYKIGRIGHLWSSEIPLQAIPIDIVYIDWAPLKPWDPASSCTNRYSIHRLNTFEAQRSRFKLYQ